MHYEAYGAETQNSEIISNWRIFKVVMISDKGEDTFLKVCLPLDESEPAIVSETDETCLEKARMIDEEKLKNEEYINKIKKNGFFKKKKTNTTTKLNDDEKIVYTENNQRKEIKNQQQASIPNPTFKFKQTNQVQNNSFVGNQVMNNNTSFNNSVSSNNAYNVQRNNNLNNNSNLPNQNLSFIQKNQNFMQSQNTAQSEVEQLKQQVMLLTNQIKQLQIQGNPVNYNNMNMNVNPNNNINRMNINSFSQPVNQVPRFIQQNSSYLKTQPQLGR